MRRSTRLLLSLSMLGTAACVPDAVTGPAPAAPAPEPAAQSASDAGEAKAAPAPKPRHPTILLRGPKSLRPDPAAAPVYVIDGVIMTGTDGLNGLAADDIASIEVIKAATARAHFNGPARNGVVIITTRRPDR